MAYLCDGKMIGEKYRWVIIAFEFVVLLFTILHYFQGIDPITSKEILEIEKLYETGENYSEVLCV